VAFTPCKEIARFGLRSGMAEACGYLDQYGERTRVQSHIGQPINYFLWNSSHLNVEEEVSDSILTRMCSVVVAKTTKYSIYTQNPFCYVVGR
jgi:hypothetical protein